jgi:hypothetical protein
MTEGVNVSHCQVHMNLALTKYWKHAWQKIREKGAHPRTKPSKTTCIKALDEPQSKNTMKEGESML